MPHVLDNPIWSALSTRLQRLNEGNDSIKFPPANVSPFVARDWSNAENITKEAWKELHECVQADRTMLSIININEVEVTEDFFDIVLSIPLYQLICPHPVAPVELRADVSEEMLVRPLTDADVPRMIELTTLTKPGPFLSHTIDYGDYVGIFPKSDPTRLIAMAGGRLQAPGYSEISAICTHPDYLGKGLASYLISYHCRRIHAQGDVPFLHVKTDNDRAIDVYKKTGFEIRAELNYKIIQRKAQPKLE